MAEQTGRSLRLSVEEQAKANNALSKFGSKADLAAQLKMSRTTINNFFKGKPVQRKQFHAICKKLKLDWQPESPKQPLTDFSDLDVLVLDIRDRIRPIIQERCGSMRVLDMNQPIELDDIYTHVNILEKITGRKRLELSELQQKVSPEEFDRFSLGNVKEQRVPGLKAIEKHGKLMILGKPGAGKTTFLKHLAIQCIGGALQAHRVPIFITLKEFAETDGQPNLLAYIDSLIPPTAGVNSRSPLPTQTPIQQILDNGRALIFLDGLDEVRETDANRVLRQIQQFADRYSRNAFVITCRIAAREYTFQQFTEVEVADFDDAQIADFSSKWFHCKQDVVKADRFVQKLEENPPIRELASNPLLLTLLCLVFEDSGDFPANRAELYQNGVDVLLKKWDVKRNIERDRVYKKLSLKRKEDLLSQIAYRTFEAGNYFFKQKDVEYQIREFIENLPGASADEQTLDLDSEAVLKSIEAHHGLFVERARSIYSFSHLTFHEYFVSRYIFINCNSSSVKDPSLNNLVKYIAEPRWREVFLLTAEILSNADSLIQLMKFKIDNFLIGDDTLQNLLKWANQKAKSIKSSHNLVATRAFYIEMFVPIKKTLFQDFDSLSGIFTPYKALSNDLALDLDLIRAFKINRSLTDFLQHRSHSEQLQLHYIDINLAGDRVLHDKLQLLDDALPEIYANWDNVQANWDNVQDWLENKGFAWTESLKIVMLEHRNIGFDWNFNEEQIYRVQQYFYSNKLLVECLNSDCYVSRSVREEIKENLLLPIAEIENRKCEKAE